MSREMIGLQTLLELKGGAVARAMDAAINRIAADIAAAKDVGDWRTLVLQIRAKPDEQTGTVICEVIVKPVKLSERVTSFIGDVRQDAGRNHRLVADRGSLGLSDEEVETDVA